MSNKKDKCLQLLSSILLEGKEKLVPGGKIDLVTDTEIIMVKDAKKWRAAINQIISFGKWTPGREKVLYLFDEKVLGDDYFTSQDFKEAYDFNLIQDICSKSNVIVNFLADEILDRIMWANEFKSIKKEQWASVDTIEELFDCSIESFLFTMSEFLSPVPYHGDGSKILQQKIEEIHCIIARQLLFAFQQDNKWENCEQQDLFMDVKYAISSILQIES